jgi:hypothetical protein
MLGLNSRKEFQDPRLRGAATELASENNTDATQVHAAAFLDITYPPSYFPKVLEAHRSKQSSAPD